MKISSIAAALVGLLMVLTLNACGDGKSDSGGNQQSNGQCAANQILNNGQCQACPANQSVVGNQCVLQCAANQTIQNGQCITPAAQCIDNQIAQNGSCVACLEAQVPNIERTMCIDNSSQCASNQIEQNGLCMTCPAGQFASGNRCTAPPLNCGANQIVQNNMCVDCGANQRVSNNMCVDIPVTCGPTQIIVNNMCVDCPVGDVVVNNMCVTPAPGNTPPVVSAGAPQTITSPTDTVTLAGSASDDGLPNPPGVLTIMWTDSGPGTVSYGDNSSLTSSAKFSAVGTYTLTLQADDGDIAVTDSVQITVNPQFNNPPTVNSLTATPANLTLPTNMSSLAGTASDDGVPGVGLTYSWSSNPAGGVSFNPGGNTLNTMVTFTSPGAYTITLTADDSLKTGSRNVAVTVNPIVCPAGQRLVGGVCLIIITNAGQCSNTPITDNNHDVRSPNCSSCHVDGRTCTVPPGFVYP